MSYLVGLTVPITLSLTDWVDPDLNALTVDIDISRDNGVSWTNIFTNQINGTIIYWTVTGPGSANCLFKYSNSLNVVYTVLGNTFSIVDNVNSILKLDYITTNGPRNNSRYGANKYINLVNYLPQYLKGGETETFLKMFQDCLNEMYDGYDGFGITSTDLDITKNYLTSASALSANYPRDYTYYFSGTSAENANTDANLVNQLDITWPTNISASTQKISILEKIKRLTELHDPELIDIEYIQYFAKNLGYNVNVYRTELGVSADGTIESTGNFGIGEGQSDGLNDDSEKYLRFMISNLPHWYKIKTTKNAINVILYSFGLIGDLIEYYTNNYLPGSSGNWRANYNNNLENVPNGYYPTPHFTILVDADKSVNLSYDISRLDKVIRAVESVKPINTVFRNLSLYAKRDMDIWMTLQTRLTRYIRIPADGFSDFWRTGNI